MRFIPLAILFFLLTGCGNDSPTAATPGDPPPVAVTATTVAKQSFSDTSVAIGNLKSAESVNISTNVTERIVSLHFDDGQLVEKGHILARLADEEEQAMLKMADAELEEDQREIERLERLSNQNAIAEVTLEERITRGKMSESRIAMNRAMVADRSITAPFSGVVGLRQISPGALVEPGDVITTLDQIQTMKLDFTVPEIYLDSLAAGTLLTATTAASPDEAFEATIATVGSRVDPVTRSLSVRALIPNQDRRLKPGMLMTVNLERNERESPAIPERAIVPVGQQKSVYIINEDDSVTLTEVQIGARIPGFVEIQSGIETGDRIVTDGLLSLKDGATVKVEGEFEGPTAAFDPTDSGS